MVLSVSDDDSDIGVSCIMEELSTASMFKRDDHNRPKNDEVIELFKLLKNGLNLCKLAEICVNWPKPG